MKLALALGALGPLQSLAVNHKEERPMSLEQTIQRLQDRNDILETMYAYCRHADMNDVDGMMRKFAEDCVVSYVPGDQYVMRGRAALKAMLDAHIGNTISGSHHIANVELLFDTPDVVTAHMYMYSWQRFKGFPVTADCHRWGRYEIRFIRQQGSWWFSRLRLLSAGEYGGARIGEQFGRPWPPRFE